MVILHQEWGSNLDGSYFNNFNSDTDVSEILRFVKGLLSSSANQRSTSSRTYSSISENKVIQQLRIQGYVSTDSKVDIVVLIGKEYSVGGTIFPWRKQFIPILGILYHIHQ